MNDKNVFVSLNHIFLLTEWICFILIRTQATQKKERNNTRKIAKTNGKCRRYTFRNIQFSHNIFLCFLFFPLQWPTSFINRGAVYWRKNNSCGVWPLTVMCGNDMCGVIKNFPFDRRFFLFRNQNKQLNSMDKQTNFNKFVLSRGRPTTVHNIYIVRSHKNRERDWWHFSLVHQTGEGQISFEMQIFREYFVFHEKNKKFNNSNWKGTHIGTP